MLGDQYKYPEWSRYLSWALTLSSILCIPIYIIYKVLITPGGFKHVSFNILFANLKDLVNRISLHSVCGFASNRSDKYHRRFLVKLREALALRCDTPKPKIRPSQGLRQPRKTAPTPNMHQLLEPILHMALQITSFAQWNLARICQ